MIIKVLIMIFYTDISNTEIAQWKVLIKLYIFIWCYNYNGKKINHDTNNIIAITDL